MIRVLGTKYKSIGNILVLPASGDEPFYVKSPIDFILEEKEKIYRIVMRYTNYNDTFDYLSCKILVSLETYDNRIVVLFVHNYMTPDPEYKDYGTGYTLTWIISYNNDSDLYMSFISQPLCLSIKQQLEQKS